MKYAHRFRVEADLASVREFHRQSASMGAITPPPVIAVIHQAPELLDEGDEMTFTLWLGPLPLRWHAQIENVTPTSFQDRQVSGPFAKWIHRHTFVPLTDGATEVVDEIEAELDQGLLKRLVGTGMWLNLPILFAYRGWKTRRLLEKTPGPQPTQERSG